MTHNSPRPERHANPKLTSQWNDSLVVPEGFWNQSEESAVAAALGASKPRILNSHRVLALAACLVGGALIWSWISPAKADGCVTFACLWESQADIPFTEDELLELDRWQWGDDDPFYDSTSF